MTKRIVIRMRSLNAAVIVLVLLLASIPVLPWAMADESTGVAPMAGSRAAFDNDLTVLGVTLPHDQDENVGSIVADNAIPVGTQSVQAEVKNIGNLPKAGGFPVDFYFETGTPTIKWSDNMDSGSANGWTTKDMSATNVHWQHTTGNTHSAGGALVATYSSGPKSGYYGNFWEEVAEMKTCVNIPASPASEPYVRLWNFTNTQTQVDGGYVQMQIGNGPWVDITPVNPFPPPTLSYRGTINSATLVQSSAKGAYTGSSAWYQSEIFPLWQQQKGEINGTCLKFRFWFASDGSNPSDYTGWFVDDFSIFDGSSTTTEAFGNANNWAFKNMNALGLSEGWQQLGGSGMVNSTNDKTTAWWAGNKTKGTYLNGTDQVLISPSISLTGGGMNEARFTYMQRYNISKDGDGGYVELSTNGGTTWSIIQPMFDLNKNDDTTKYPGYIDANSDYGKLGAFSGNASWHKMAFDLTSYIGQNVMLRFHMFSNWDNKIDQGWFIDNVEVKTWNFIADGTGSATVNGLNAGQKAVSALNQPYLFDTETDYRIRVIVDKTGDQDQSNNELHVVIRVKNIRDMSVTVTSGGTLRTVNHGGTLKYWMNVTNLGNLADNYTIAVTGLPTEWNITVSPTKITNLRPIDPPFLVMVTIITTIGSGPTTYPDQTKQQKDYPFTVTVQSENLPSLVKSKGFTSRITNTRPTVDFLLENVNGKVYQPLEISMPLFSDNDKDPLTFMWVWGDGSQSQNTTTWPVFHTYTKSRTAANPYVIKLKVTDGLATSDESTLNVTITNAAPTAKFIVTAPIPVNNTYAANVPMTFNATTSKDENPATLTFNWLFGDGNSGNGIAINHSYETGGVKMVTLSVLDEEDAINEYSLNISINTPPTPVITSPAQMQEFYLGEDIVFNASSTSDNEQKLSELEFLWSSNIAGDLGNQMVFTKAFTSKDDVLVHKITLTVNDHKAKGVSYIQRDIVIKARPQNLPSLEKDLSLATVSPDGGFVSTTTFTYSILYKDKDNDKPSFVRLVIDKGTSNEKLYDMAQENAADKDYTIGVLFQTKVPGNGIGADSLHTFFFETADERNITAIVKSADYTGPRIVREKMIQNLGLGNVPSGVAFAKVRYVGPQSQDPVKLQILADGGAAPPNDINGKPLLSVGFNVSLTFVISQGMWDNATLQMRYGADAFKTQRDNINLSSIKLYKLEGGTWVVVTGADNDDTGMVVSMPATTTGGTYALFGTKKEAETGGCTGKNCKQNVDYTPYILAAIVIAAVVAIVVGVFLLTRKKKATGKQWGGKDGIDLKIDVLSGTGTDESAVKPVGKEEGGADAGPAAVPMETTTGESVAIYRPAVAPAPAGEEGEDTSGVAVFRPGAATAAPVGEEEEVQQGVENAQDEQNWTPPPATETEEAQPAPPVEEAPPPEEPKKEEKKGSDDDLLNEILGEEK